MASEELDLSVPIVFSSEEERRAAVAFFNAAFRAEESGLRQAHSLAAEFDGTDPDLAECLRLYGDEEGWHRQLLTEFLCWIGESVRPMGRTTRTFYKLYARAERMESIVLVNLMFETIGSTTYRLALRRARHPAVRQMLTILTRDESFHVPLNVHFLRAALERAGDPSRFRLKALYKATLLALLASTVPSRRRAEAFDRITRPVLTRAYATELSRLFLQEDDLGLAPSAIWLKMLGLDMASLAEAPSSITLDAAEKAANRDDVVVEAY
jgi:hypothetical protein